MHFYEIRLFSHSFKRYFVSFVSLCVKLEFINVSTFFNVFNCFHFLIIRRCLYLLAIITPMHFKSCSINILVFWLADFRILSFSMVLLIFCAVVCDCYTISNCLYYYNYSGPVCTSSFAFTSVIQFLQFIFIVIHRQDSFVKRIIILNIAIC